MNTGRSIGALLALAIAFQIPSPAQACRVGLDQHLFELPPPPSALAGATIIRVSLSSSSSATDKWPKDAADPRGGSLRYTLIGVARTYKKATSGAKAFPVYALITSCSGLRMRPAPDGAYYLIGRFDVNERRQRFYAGGRRVDNGGKDIYGGWHF